MPLCTGTRIIPPPCRRGPPASPSGPPSGEHRSASMLRTGSALQPVEEPARSDHLGSQVLGSSPELAIGGDEGDDVVGCSAHDVDERVITTSFGVHDGDAIGDAGRRTLAGLALEDDDDGLIDPAGGGRRPDLRSRKTSAAPARSRHHPVGRDPMTFAASTRSMPAPRPLPERPSIDQVEVADVVDAVLGHLPPAENGVAVLAEGRVEALREGRTGAPQLPLTVSDAHFVDA